MAKQLGLGVDGEFIDVVSNSSGAMASDSRPAGLWGPRVASDENGSIVGINGGVFGLFDDEGNASENFQRGPDSRPAEELLALYKRSGLDCIPKLRGFFSLAIWDAPKETLYLITDRYALRSLYYFRDGDSVLFASEVKAILAAAASKPAVDEHGLADYMLLGMPLGNRTLFQGISLIPPASIYAFTSGKMEERLYWQLQFNEDKKLTDIEHTVDLFSTAFEAAIADSLDGPNTFELPLSGGLDSRCIGAVAAGEANLRSYTMGGYASEDLKLGPLVAERLGFSNMACPLKAGDFVEWIAPSVYITDGMYSPINAPILALARRFPADARIVLDGANSFDGSFKAYDLFLNQVMPGKYSTLNQAITICPQPIVDSSFHVNGKVLAPDFLETSLRHLESTYHEFHASIPKESRKNPFDIIDFLDQSNRVRRFNMMGTVLLRPFCEVRQPFFDHRVVDLVTRLPVLLRSKEKLLMGRYLTRLNPFLASLIYERTGLPANANLFCQILGYVKRGVRRVSGRLIPMFKEKPRIAIDYMHWLKTDPGLQAYIAGILFDERALSRSHINREEMKPFVNALFAGKKENLFLTMRLLSIELWYRYFIEGDAKPEFPPLHQKPL